MVARYGKIDLYAIRDIAGAARNLRAWSYLAAKQLQMDYRRNLLGSAWIFIGFAITAGGIGWLIAQLQGRELSDHIPYVAFAFVAWNFIQSIVGESSIALTRNRALLLQAPMERSVFAFSLSLKKFYLMALQLITACAVAAVFGWRPSATLFLLIPAFAVFAYAAVGTALLLSVVGAVLRDLNELLSAVMRLAFFFTPIIWVAESRFDGERAELEVLSTVVAFNPFSYFIELIRGPALGTAPDVLTWVVTIGLSTVIFLLGLISLQIFGRRLVFWL